MSTSSDVLDTQSSSTIGPVTSVSSVSGARHERDAGALDAAGGVATAPRSSRPRAMAGSPSRSWSKRSAGADVTSSPSGSPLLLCSAALQLQIQLRPLRARERPLVLEAELVAAEIAAAGADHELHRRLVHDPGVDALQPVVEEAQLVEPAFLGMERMEVRAGVDAQLLVLRGRVHEAFGVAAQVQPRAGPVADAVERHRDLRPIARCAGARTRSRGLLTPSSTACCC